LSEPYTFFPPYPIQLSCPALQRAGEPVTLTDSQLEERIRTALRGFEEERARSQPTNLLGQGFNTPLLRALPAGHRDPAVWQAMTPAGLSTGSQMDGSMEDWLKQKFPALKSLPSSGYKLDLPSLLSINDALVRDTRAFKKLEPEAKLSQNLDWSMLNPTVVEQGLDDRKTVLHQARFLGGATCSAQDLWLKARELLGNGGVQALGGYDLDAVGCGGSVTAKGWLEIHNPASTSISLKQFHMANVSSSALSSKRSSSSDGGEGDSMKEICDMEELKSAMFTLREAMAAALPWNRSISAIQGFLNVSGYCKQDLEGRPNRAAILTAFINYILSRNAMNWHNKQHFISTNDMLHVWTTWFGQQPASAVQPKRDAQKQRPDRRDKSDLCRRYNDGNCPTKGSTCKTFYGRVLRHLCNATTSSGRICEKPHPKIDHK